MGFLENLVKVFPNLATRPLHITGESYAGTYIVSGLFLQASGLIRVYLFSPTSPKPTLKWIILPLP